MRPAIDTDERHWPTMFTHAPLLAAAAANSTGPILELGGGHGSTPLLHEICRPTRRELWTYEDSWEWFAAEFSDLACEWHRLHRVPSRDMWRDMVYPNRSWGMVFIDHGNGDQRADSIRHFADVAETWVVVHDSHPSGVELYRYGPAFDLYRYRWTFDRYWPHSTVLSNHRPWA